MKASPYTLPGIDTKANPLVYFCALIKTTEPMDIINRVADEWSAPTADLFIPCRKSHVVTVRQVCMVIFHFSLKLNPQENADFFNQDRTTIYHSIKTVTNLWNTDKYFRKRLLNLLDDI